MSINDTSAIGIHQAYLILQSAIEAAIADLRANPWLLDYCFKSLPYDTLTSDKFGEKQLKLAKEWFLKSTITVVPNIRADANVKVPCVSISAGTSVESNATLGDVHYDPQEDNADYWPSLYGPFSPVSYDATTGIIVFPSDISDVLVLAIGQQIVTKIGQTIDIIEVIDSTSAKIAPEISFEINKSTIRGKKPTKITTLESVEFQEMYSIGCHAPSEVSYIYWLHSIIEFCLLRYKQVLLEERGFERTQIKNSEVRKEWDENSSEFIYSRYISITGIVRNVWPKAIFDKINTVLFQPVIDGTDSVLTDSTDIADINSLDAVDSFGNILT